MERIRKLFERRISYEPLEGGSERPNGEVIVHPRQNAAAFSWIEYSVFLLLGVAMLWAWNMFLAAAPYFQTRFEGNSKLLHNFQSAELSVSTIGNLGSMIVLQKLQARANYPKRIIASLLLNIVIFSLLAMSTRIALGIPASLYFVFLMVMCFVASLATGLCQNGVFAFVSSFGHEAYTQGIMTGQGVAGVLPCLVQIISVLSVPEKKSQQDEPHESSTSAFVYFLTAAAVSGVTLIALIYLLSRDGSKERLRTDLAINEDDNGSPPTGGKKPVPFAVLFKKLRYLSIAIFLTFTFTMSFFPVFTTLIQSVRDPANSSRIFQPATFIPLAFLVWNVADLIGRMLPAIPALRFTAYPRFLVGLSTLRVLQLPLYMLCNVQNMGASVGSDFFYLFIIQFPFGLTNGFLGSNCMMGLVEYVDAEEREAAGGFMSLCLVAGLTAGSLLSFVVSAPMS